MVFHILNERYLSIVSLQHARIQSEESDFLRALPRPEGRVGGGDSSPETLRESPVHQDSGQLGLRESPVHQDSGQLGHPFQQQKSQVFLLE